LKILLSYLACNKPSPPLVTSKKKLTQKLKHLLLYVAKKIYIKKFKSAKIKVLFKIFNSHNSTKI
jgi:hypothetical protein